MATFQPPPTYAEVVLYDKTAKDSAALLASAKFNPIWLKWFLDLVKNIPSGGAGSVSNVSFVNANGISGSVANPTTTPAITLALGAITPSSVVTGAITATGNLTLGGSGNITLAPGNPATGGGGNTFDGGVITQNVTGNYQVVSQQWVATSGTAPEWGPITELVLGRTHDQATNLQRISLTAMAAFADPGLTDAATDYRLQQEASGTGAILDIKFVSQKNSSGHLLEYLDLLAAGGIQVFRRTDSPAPLGSTLELGLEQSKRGTANVLTANGTQDSPKLRLTGNSYDGSLHRMSWRQSVNVTSNAGASTYLLQYDLDSGGYATKLSIDDAAVVTARNKIYPGTDGAAAQSAAGIYAGTGAPSNANGSNGDYYFRSDGGAVTHLYFKSAGTWAGII